MRAAELGVLQKRTPNLLEAFAVFLHVVASQRFSIVCVVGFFELVAQRHCAYVLAAGWETRRVPGPPLLFWQRRTENCSTKHALRFVKIPAQKPALGSFRFLRVLQQIQNRLIHDRNEQSPDGFSLEFAGLRLHA
jgi:hypothetical protein